MSAEELPKHWREMAEIARREYAAVVPLQSARYAEALESCANDLEAALGKEQNAS